VREARVEGIAAEAAAVLRDSAMLAESLQASEQQARLGERGGRRRIQPRQLAWIRHPSQCEVERQRSQIRLEDLRRASWHQ
jgi:hypothetical protein